MITLYIHRSLLSERVWDVISAITLEAGRKPNEFGYIGIRGDNDGMPKTLALKADVIIDEGGYVLKTPLLDIGEGATLPEPIVSWELLPERLIEEFDLGKCGFISKSIAYIMGAPSEQPLSEEDMMTVRQAFAMSMTDREVYDSLDDVLLDENGCSKSSDGVVMLSPDLANDLNGKSFLYIGGSLFIIQRVGYGFGFTFIPSDKILEI